MSADLRQRIADAIYATHGCSCDAHYSNGMSQDCQRWLRAQAERGADAVLAVLREAGTVEERFVCTDAAPGHLHLNCRVGHTEQRAVITLPWTAVEE